MERLMGSPPPLSTTMASTAASPSPHSAPPLLLLAPPPLPLLLRPAPAPRLPPPSPAQPPFATPGRRPLLRHSIPASTMREYRHMRGGSLNVPNGAAGPGSQMMPRSPPNTSHVPCKFFRQGTCQAGNTCPFSHDIGASAETVCKYFAKGNCKFGPKCANVHVLPDGRRINYGKNGVTIGAAPISLAGGRAPSLSPASPTTVAAGAAYPPGRQQPGPASALTSSLYRADLPPYPPAYPGDDRHRHHARLDSGAIPAIDMPYPASNYGSPRDDDAGRLGFGHSPANGKGLSVLDAPLPSSFDSNGISNAARFPSAPWPSSVPSKFGLDSPTPSLSNAKDSRTSETLKLLHTSAFGSSELLVAPTASSPPGSQPAAGEEFFGRCTMHSSRYARPRMLSSSLPKTTASVDRDWEAEFAFGDDGDNAPENYVPENLQDLLTPAEKARRGSMRADGDAAGDASSKYGSPLASSPSRWGSLFQRHKDDDEAMRAARNAGSAFGHVGSPLRRSTLAQEMGDDLNRAPNGGSCAASASRAGSESMSVLSQQLQRSRLDDNVGGSSPLLHPTAAAARISGGGAKDRAMERHVSSGSMSSSMTGRFTTPIDEEDPPFVFSMEEEEDSGSSKTRKRTSAGMGMGAAGLGSYAGAIAGKGGNGTKEPRDAAPVNGR